MAPQTEQTQRLAQLANGISLEYIDTRPSAEPKGTIVLIHGFPQTAYQFRHITGPLASARYRVVAPNYRGAGRSSKPQSGFTKSILAEDIIQLLDYLGIKSKVHIVGHDIGGMIAYPIASRYPDRIHTVNWGECPLPGTSIHDYYRTERAVDMFHFIFHSVRDLPEALVEGREEIYLRHFYDKLAFNTEAIGPEDLDYYVKEYSRPGAMRCGFEVYRAFLLDAEENRDWIAKHGKCKVPALCLQGEKSPFAAQAGQMASEVHEDGTCDVDTVPGAAHWLAEENPEGFVEKILGHIRKHKTG